MHDEKTTKVLLIGGAPGAGKTTLGMALAARLGSTSLSIDDLFSAAKAVTTPDSHPGLHVMSGGIEYFTRTSPEQLQADADVQHEATWPAVEKVIRNHSAHRSAIVMEGWFLRPSKVARLGLENVTSFWLVADPSVLEQRERENTDFFGQSSDPERMLKNFLARSLWYNDLIKRQAAELKLVILEQDGSASVDDLCRQALDRND